ncbi:hypothetical protein ACFVMC_32875 [Nocardia sp. NPDC127579]|uniref:hypothetical protein n=1 Tax=Nocardia sp. NPDC127579 TaxID=3345402 RepID=UPI00363D8F85
MGRRRNPIHDPEGPIGQFALKLRAQMDAIPGRTFRKMSTIANISHSTLAEAAGGKKFPTWEATRAFLIGCDIDPDLIESQWKAEWSDAERAVAETQRVLGTPPASARGSAPVRAVQLRAVPPALADPEQWRPQPDTVQTFDDLLYELKRFKIAIGNPGLRTLSVMTSRFCSLTALSDVFSGKRPPAYEMYVRLIDAMLMEVEEQSNLFDATERRRPWRSMTEWRSAWTRSETNRERPDLTRHRRYGNIFLITDGQDEGPTASIVAEMDPEVAAALLASLAPKIAGNIISDLPTKHAQAVLTAIEKLHRRPSPVERPAPGPW